MQFSLHPLVTSKFAKIQIASQVLKTTGTFPIESKYYLQKALEKHLFKFVDLVGGNHHKTCNCHPSSKEASFYKHIQHVWFHLSKQHQNINLEFNFRFFPKRQPIWGGTTRRKALCVNIMFSYTTNILNEKVFEL